ncbi:MAG: hypothetical protein GXW85_06005 [Clostridia bacterium]|nr:hypothetical protein [Clostridia bacterium]
MTLLFQVFLIFSFLVVIDNNKDFLFMPAGDNFIPAGAGEKMAKKSVTDFLNPTLWVFMGIFILLYLKILWKLVNFNWKYKNKKEKKQRLKSRVPML